MSDAELEIATWDELISESGQMELRESAPAWKERYLEAIDLGAIKIPKLSPEEYADFRFEAVKKERRRRSKNLRSDLEYLLDTLELEEDGANLDSIMGLAYPLGNRADKTLSAWGIDDLMYATAVRERVKKRLDLAVSFFGNVAVDLSAAMEERGSLDLGGLMRGGNP